MEQRTQEIDMNGHLYKLGKLVWNLIRREPNLPINPSENPIVPVSAHAGDEVPQFTPQEWRMMFYQNAVVQGYSVRPGWKGYCLYKVEQ